ncbi:MAG: ATP-binding protein [Myxococcaceae bacterium]
MAELILAEYRCYEHLPVPVCIVRRNHIAYVNRQWADLMRIPRERLIGLPMAEAIAATVSPEDRKWLDPIVERIVAGDPPKPESWLKLLPPGAGSPLMEVRTAAGPSLDEFTVIISNAQGEAEAQRFMHALSSATERLMRCREERDVLDTAVQVLWEQGLLSVVMLKEPGGFRHGPMRQPEEAAKLAEKAYGRPLTEVVFPNEVCGIFLEVLSSRRSHFHNDMEGVLRKMHPPEVLQIIFEHFPPAHGVDAPLIVDGVPFGILAGFSPTLTPTMAATIELFARHVSAALENTRHYRAADEAVKKLQHLQAELVTRERLAALGEAAAVLAHEVRNPLAAILNGLSMLKRDPQAKPENHVVFRMVEEEALHLENVVHDLLDFTRPIAPRRTEVALGDAVRHTVQVLRDRREDSGVSLNVVAEEIESLSADANLLHLALENLLRNAIQASPPGGNVTVRVDRNGPHARIAVEDEGPGIPHSDVGRIFEPFFTTRARGTGLGLPVVRRVVQAHGGEVRVGRASRGGALFEVMLPFKAEGAP